LTADHAAHPHEEHESRYREGDAAAWDRPLRDTELYDPARRDVYNFIDETKVRYLRPMLPPAGNAIEVGAGSGRLLIRLGQENLRRSALPGDALFGDALALPFADASFDVVLSGGLLEHFREPGEVIREMARVLRPAGLFYADIVPRKVSLYRWAERTRMAHDEHLAKGIYESDFPKRAWARLARESGLRDVRIVSGGGYPPYTRPGFEQLLWRYPGFFRALDGTPVADVLGFFYMLTGRK